MTDRQTDTFLLYNIEVLIFCDRQANRCLPIIYVYIWLKNVSSPTRGPNWPPWWKNRHVTNAGHQMTSMIKIVMSSMRGPNWPFRCLDNYVHSQFPPFSRYMVLQVRQGTGHFTTSYIKAEQNLPLWDRSFPGRNCHAFVKWTFVKGSRALPTTITIRLWPISGKAV